MCNCLVNSLDPFNSFKFGFFDPFFLKERSAQLNGGGRIRGTLPSLRTSAWLVRRFVRRLG